SIRDALNRGSRRNTSANNRLADVRIRKMRGNQPKPRTGNGGRTLRCCDVIHSTSLIIRDDFVPNQRKRRRGARRLVAAIVDQVVRNDAGNSLQIRAGGDNGGSTLVTAAMDNDMILLS